MDNKSKKYDYLIFIGRFQPFHLGHQQVVTQALDITERLIVLVGSAERPRCTRNPWTYVEREMMIRESLADVAHRITIKPLPDATYDEATWQSFVQSQVTAVLETHGVCETETRIGLIGHAKDATSYYVKSFPQWPFQEVGNATGICATLIREQLLSGGGLPERALGPAVARVLRKSLNNETFQDLQAEMAFILNYRSRWQAAPYPPTFITVDAVVVHRDRVLLIKRDGRPGKGLWALPGGFVDNDESLENAMLRELQEETCIDVPAATLIPNIRTTAAFDDPHRSARGRTISHAYLITLPDDLPSPRVEGADDAALAEWVALDSLEASTFYEDHFFIIQKLLGTRAATVETPYKEDKQ